MNNLIVEPFLPHLSNTEYHVCITSARESNLIRPNYQEGPGHTHITEIVPLALGIETTKNKISTLLKSVQPDTPDPGCPRSGTQEC
jgi:hypothetical protein